MKIGIGVVTRNRARMLAQLLASFARLRPSGHEIRFIVVENDPVGTEEVRETIEKFKARLLETPALSDAAVDAETEPQLGIAHARNRVLDMAAKTNCDFLAFTDDDCQVAPDWIAELMQAQRSSNADLTANYVRYSLNLDACSPLQKYIARGFLRKEDMRVAKAISMNQPHMGTGNWLVSMPFVQAHSMRFDTSVGFMPGEDVRFYKALQRAKGTIALAPLAHVEETWTSDRLTPGHLFQRARATQIAISRHKRPSPIRSVFSVLAKFHGKFLLCVLRMPFDRGVSFVRAIEQLGKIAGRIDYMMGRTVTLYRPANPKLECPLSKNP